MANDDPDPEPAEHPAVTIAGLAIGAVVVGCVLLFAWASRRGLDITDEGLYLLHQRLPGPDPYFPSQYDVVADVLLGPLGQGAVTLRLARVVLEVASGALLGGATVVAVGRHGWRVSRAGAMVIVATTTAFALLSHTWLPGTLSYNTLSAVLVTSAVALALLAAGRSERRTRADYAYGAGIGAVLAVQLAVKWPPAFATAVVVACVVVALRPRAALRVLASACAGGVVVILVLTDIGVGSTVHIDALVDANRLTSETAAFDPPAVLRLYARTLREDLRTAVAGRGLVATAAFALVFLPAALAARQGWSRRAAGVAVAAGAAGLAVVAVLQVASGDGPIGEPSSATVVLAPIVAVAVAAVVAALGTAADRRRRLWPVLVVVAVLAVTPSLASAGSSNPLLLQSLTASAGYGSVVAVAGVAISRRAVVGRAGPALGVLLAVVIAAAQIVRGTVFEPYRVASSLGDHGVSVGGPGLWGLLLDPPSAAFVRELRDVARESGFRPGDVVLGVSRVPGLVLVLGGVPPGPAFIPSGAYDQSVACRALEDDLPTLLRTEIVLVADDPVTPDLDACLTRLWPAWQQGLELVASLPNPWAATAGMAPDLRVYVVRGP